MGDEEVGMKRAVIVMNPQTGEVLALVNPPTYDNNLFSGGISPAEYGRLLNDPDKPLLNHATRRTTRLDRPTSWSPGPAVWRTARSRRDEVLHGGYLTLGATASTTGTGAASVPATSIAASDTPATRTSSRSRAGSGSIASATGRSSTASATRPGSTCPTRPPASSPRTLEEDALGAQIFPRRGLPGGHRPGYDVVTPIQLINAYAALANGGTLYQPQLVGDIVGPDGTVVRPFAPKVVREDGRSCQRPQGDAQRRPGDGHASATRTTSSSSRSRSPASQARRSSAPGTGADGCHSTRGSSGSCRRTPPRARSTARTRS